MYPVKADTRESITFCEYIVFSVFAGLHTLSLCSSAWQMMSSQMDADGAKQ